MIKLKLFLILKKRESPKSILKLVENDLDRFLSRRGYTIVSYEVVEGD